MIRKILREITEIRKELAGIRKELQIINYNLKPVSKVQLDGKAICQAVQQAIDKQEDDQRRKKQFGFKEV